MVDEKSKSAHEVCNGSESSIVLLANNSNFKRTKKHIEDPSSHRVTEKRRRDRMNNCLADLSKLIPNDYLKKCRGRIEKTEIVEMAIKHIKYLQVSSVLHANKCNSMNNVSAIRSCSIINDKQFVNGTRVSSACELSPQEHYKLGYQECAAETIRFLVDHLGFIRSDGLSVKLTCHLQKYYEKLTKGDTLVSKSTDNTTSSNMEMGNTYLADSINIGYDTRSAAGSLELGSLASTLSKNVEKSGSEITDPSQQGSNNGVDENLIQNRQQYKMMQLDETYIPTMQAEAIQDPSANSDLSNNDLINDACSTSGSMYKFKNYIRERFEHSNSEKSSYSLPFRIAKKKSCSSLISWSSQYSSVHEQTHNDPRSVPIFALHAKGSFYVPLTVDSRLLAPYISELSSETPSRGFSSLFLHPVTISVNFNRPSTQSTALVPSALGCPSKMQEDSAMSLPECDS